MRPCCTPTSRGVARFRDHRNRFFERGERSERSIRPCPAFPGEHGRIALFVRPGRGVVSKWAMNQLLRSSEKLGCIVRSDGLDGAPRDLSASPGEDMSSTRKFSTTSATWTANGAPSLGPSALRSSRSCSRFCGRACRLARLAGVAAVEVARWSFCVEMRSSQ
jgi:hypothetical protein